MSNKDTIYTRNEAADIIELFEDVLDDYDITVPSPEDDARDDDNKARLYGSVYFELLDHVEDLLIDLIMRASLRPDVIFSRFS